MQGRSSRTVGASFKEEITKVGSIEDCKKKCEQRVEDGVAECRSILYFTIKKNCYILEEPYDATGRTLQYNYEYAKMSQYFNSYMTSYDKECERKAQCSTIATAVGWCGSSKVYNAKAASTECAASPKACTKANDEGKCCTAPAKCSTIKDPKLKFCGDTMVYNSAADNANCAASECNPKTPSDVRACCSDRAKCSSVFANPECIPNDKLSWGSTPASSSSHWAKDGWTRVKTPNGVGQNGFAYHPGAAQKCSSGDMWGTNPMAACQYAKCPSGYTANFAGIKYLGKNPNPADLVPVGWDPWKPSGGSPNGWYYADTCPCKSTFCGKSDSGIGYNSAAANALCAGTACSSSTASDVTACCKTRATCSTIASKSGFCGAGKYNSAAANVLCAGTACASPADVGACCTAPAAK